MSLSNVDTDNLVSRWNTLFGEYKEKLKNYQEMLLEIQKIREELYLIRDELSARNIDVENGESVPP